jgi:Tfp pilus assembly ATPase PilU
MIGTPAIRNLIRENKIAQMYSAIQTGRNIGMQTLDQNLQELVSAASSRAARRAARRPTRTCSPARRRVQGGTMEREQATKFMYDLLRALLAKKGSDLFHHARISAGDEGRRQDEPGVADAADQPAHLDACALDHERQAGSGFEATKECNFAINPRASAASASTRSSSRATSESSAA